MKKPGRQEGRQEVDCSTKELVHFRQEEREVQVRQGGWQGRHVWSVEFPKKVS